MSDEQFKNEDFKEQVSVKVEEQSPASVEKKTTAKKAKKEMRVICSPACRLGMFDPDHNLRIPAAGNNPVTIPGPVKKGSWLDAQMQAGLVVEA